MIVNIRGTRQYLVKLLIALALGCFPQSLAVAQPMENLENNINTLVTVKKILVTGYTVFSEREIEEIIKVYHGEKLSFSELRNITKTITDLYVSRGYITSGAFLPEQEIVDGIINVQVIEGKLEDIKIKGLKNLQENYISSFISSTQTSQVLSSSKQSPPLNINSLKNDLNLLKRNSSIKNIEAELVQGTESNLSVLLIEIEEIAPFQAKLSFDNYRSPSVGEFQGTLKTSYGNLIGVSDRAFGHYNLSSGFDAYSVGYEIPLNSKNGTISLEYRNGDSEIIEDSFNEVDIRAESDTVSLQYRQPIIYQLEKEVALGIAFKRQNSATFILDDLPFSFTTGPQQGRSVVSVLKLMGSWLERSPNSVFALSSELNFGLDLFDATVNDSAPDGLFFSWLGQVQWTKALNQDRNLLLVTRLATQLTPDSLLPLEQLTLGGIGTIRGYRQNQEVGDNGVVGTIEIYVPLVGDHISSSNLNLIPFFDGGTVWNNNDSDSETDSLISLGIGLDWQFKDFLSLRVDWGVPLINTSNFGNSLQDNGFSFSFQLKPF